MATDYPISIESHKMKSNKERAFVDPPIIDIGDTPGDTVTWTNNTTRNSTLWFPNGGKVFDPYLGTDFSEPIVIAPGTDLKLTIKGVGPDQGYYKYSVYCEKVGEFAQGNSEPGLHVP